MNKSFDMSFHSYGSFYDDPADPEKNGLVCQEITTSTKKLDHLYLSHAEVQIECPLGIALLLVASSPDLSELETYPIRCNITLRPGVYFNLIPLAPPVTWRLLSKKDMLERKELPSPYTYQSISIPFHVRKILDSWFTKRHTTCQIQKPAHRCYELIYVYEGSMDITLSTGIYSLQPHDLIIYRSDTAILDVGPECGWLTTTFDLNQRKALHIQNHLFHCTNEMQQVLWKLLIESKENSAYTKTLMVCYLQEALLLLMQFYEALSHKAMFSDASPARNDLLTDVLAYMNKQITEPLTIEEICHEFYISRSSLQALFKTHLNTSPKNYLLNIKLQKSKELIRENQNTISEIAYMLGFSSIHYFSRLFKRYFNTTPSAYSRKIAENHNKSHTETPK